MGILSLVVFMSQCDRDKAGDVVAGGAPSGLSHELHEAIYEPKGAPIGSVQAVRLRYVQPKLAGEDAVAFETIEPDLQYLCDTDGLAKRAKSAPNATEIIVSIASEAAEFGESVPDIVQYFDVFIIEQGKCVWGGL